MGDRRENLSRLRHVRRSRVHQRGSQLGNGPGIIKKIRYDVTTTGKTATEKAVEKDAKADDAKKTEPAKSGTAKQNQKKAEKK